MRTRIINRGGFRWFNDRNATSIVYIPPPKNLSGVTGEFRIRLYDNVRNSNDRCKNRWRGNRAGLDIKGKEDFSRIFFPSIPLHPCQRGWHGVHYLRYQFMRCFAEKFSSKDHFGDEGSSFWVVHTLGGNRDFTSNGIILGRSLSF